MVELKREQQYLGHQDHINQLKDQLENRYHSIKYDEEKGILGFNCFRASMLISECPETQQEVTVKRFCFQNPNHSINFYEIVYDVEEFNDGNYFSLPNCVSRHQVFDFIIPPAGHVIHIPMHCNDFIIDKEKKLICLFGFNVNDCEGDFSPIENHFKNLYHQNINKIIEERASQKENENG